MKNTTKWMVIAAALMITAVAVVGIVGQADDSYADPEYEARIGETNYATLADAVAAATDDQTVVLLVDVETSLSVTNTAQFSLDFNGNTLTGSITNAGNLTLTDSAESHGGIVNTTTVNAITNNGTLTIEKISVSKTAGSQYLIYNTGTLTIIDGTFNHTISDGQTGSMVRGADSTNNTIAIEGGTFTYGGNNAMLMAGDRSTITVSGGTFTVNNDAPNLLCNWNIMTITGGTFNYDADTGGQICFANDIAGKTSTLTINGGTFSSSGLNLYSGNFGSGARNADRVYDGAFLVFGSSFSMASFTYDKTWYEISENKFSRLAAAGTEGTGTACISDGAVTPTYTVTIRPLVDSNGSVDVGTVANVPAGSKITVNDNKITINGTVVTATPADPTPAKMHEFAQWAVGEVPLADQTPVNGDMTILAEFTDDLRKYTITFRNYDESLVWSYEPYYDETIMFGGENPTKPDDVPHTYQFTGWNTDKTATSGQDLGKVYGDTTFYAIYLEFTYTVSIVDSSSHTRYYIQLEDALEWAYVYGSDITLIGNPAVTHETTITHPTTIDGQGQYWITIDGVEVKIDTDFTVRNLADLKFDNDGRLLIKVSFDGNYTDAPEPAVLYSSFTLDGTTGDPDGHYVLPESPTRSGYTFKGWFTQATGGTQVTSQTVLAKTSAHTLYAHWDQVYTVTYSITNGQDIQQGSAVSGVDFVSQPIVPNEHCALPTTDDITVTVGGAATQNYQYDIYGVIAIDSTYVTGDIVITAVCPIEKYAITLAVSEEGYGTVDPTSIANQAYGTTYSVDGVVLTIGTTPITAARAADTSQYAYTFDGWYIGESKIGEAGTITGATTFTAKFTRTAFVARIGDTGYATFEAAFDAAQNDDVITLLADCAVTSQLTLNNKNIGIDGAFTVTVDGVEFDLSGEAAITLTNGANLVTANSGSIHIETKYRRNYDPPSDMVVGQNYTPGAKYVLPANEPTRDGYLFNGWWTLPEGGTQVTADTEMELAAKYFYAHWTQLFTVTLSTGDGYTLAAKAGSSSPVAYGGSYTFTFALDEAYSKSSAVVKVNDVTVTLVGGEYTITDIEADQTVTVTGVTINTYTVIFNAMPNGYGSVSKSTISGVPHGSTVAISGNTLTLNGTTVTASPAASTEEYTYAFSSWSVPDGYAITYTNQTITATFVQNVITKHSVTYDLDGGSGEAPTQADVAEGATFTVAAYSGTKAGFTFGGWNDGSATYQSGADYTMGTADVTLTAVWNAIPKHSVTYDLDGGSGDAPTQADVAEGATFTVAAYSGTKAGFTFGGWNDGTTAYQPGSEYTMGTADVTLTAVWDAIPTHHVTYVLNGGSGEAPTQADVAEGATFTVAAYSGTKAGHTFGGWNDGSKAYAAGDSYTMGTVDVTLTAVWNAESYAVTIVGEGVTVYNGDVVVKNGDLVAYGSHLTTSLAPRTGYNGAVEPETADVTGPVTFTVSYVPITYSIAFDANGGEGTMANIGATYDAEAVLTANAFTRADYAFGGWAMAADGKAVYSDKAAVTNLTSTDSATVTLYATWLQVEKKDGTAEITVTTNEVSDQAAQAVIDAAKEIAAAGTSATAEFNASETDDVSVKSDYVKEAADNNIAVTIGTKSGSLELPSEALKNLNVGSDAVIKTEIKNVERPSGYDLDKNAVVFSVLLTNNDVAYTTQFGTSFTVKLAFTPAAGVDTSNLKVMYLAGDGTLEEMSGCTYENGFMSFSTSHLSSYAIVDGSSSGGAGGSGSDSDWGLIAFVLIITALLIVVISMPVIAEKRGRQ